MLRSWRAEERVKLFSVEELGALPRGRRLAVVLSSHIVRYAVLPWSAALASEEEWLAYAQHTFASTHGSIAAGWRIRLSPAGRGKPRVACAVDAALLDSLRAIPGVVSVQPSLMAEFNARRAELARGAAAWLVLQESGRLLLSLIAGGAWRLIRARQAGADWRDSLPELLERELAASGEPACERVVLCEGGA